MLEVSSIGAFTILQALKKSHFIQLFSAVLLVLLAQACSVKKDSFTSRSYHNLTSRFNGYFNGNEKVKEGVATLEMQHQDDYDYVLPIFIYGDEESSKSVYPEMNSAIEKCSRVIDRHSMKIKGKERCRWIDDNYFVIGKAHFYKRTYLEAERLFGYTARGYKDQDRSKEATLWMARTYIELERYSKARNMLTILKEEKEDLPKSFPLNELAAVEADMNMKQGKVDHAIERLEEAVYLTKKNRDKARWAFILAQLYDHKGQNERAVKQFQRVVKMNPPYEMAFYAKINQALSFDGADSKGVRKMLEKMLKDEKNIEYYDQVWYALADIEYKEGFKDLAIEDLKTSAKVSTINTKQKGKSFMRLADIYFEDRMYRDAQVYYDSTVAFLPADHPDYEAVANKAEVLGELVEYVETVIVEDSLQALAQLDEAELEKKINKMISNRKAEEEEKERLELEAREAQLSQNVAQKPGNSGNSGGGKGEWYFYNPNTLGKGFSEFAKKWGNRTLEDDWRRKDKSQTLAFEEEEGEEIVDDPKGEKEEAEWTKPEFYTQNLPKNAADIAASNARIAEALYKSGLLYKERLDDNDNAIESFETLNARFDSCQYSLESYYQLYRMYLYKEENENYFSPEMKNSSGWYKDILLFDYPNSEYAMLIKDPNRLAQAERDYKEQEAAYREVFRGFKNRQYIGTMSACNSVINSGEANAFIKKYYFMRAMCYGGLRDRNNYRSELQTIVANFPNTEEATEAQRLLTGLDRMSEERSDKVSSELPPVEESAYIFDPDNEHFFALIFPKTDGSVNNVKTKISNFNRQYFSDIELSISNSYIDQDNQIVLVRTLSDKVKAMDYYSTFKSNQDMLKEVNEKAYPIFAISPENYATLFKDKDVAAYTTFFESKYLN